MPHIGYALCIVFLREGMHLELSIPILYANKPVGTLSIEQDGLYTVYTGACAVPELRSLRLSVYGEDSEAYLGLMVPDGEGVLSLRKRLRGARGDPGAGEHVGGHARPGRCAVARGGGRHTVRRAGRAGVARDPRGARRSPARGAQPPA